MLYYITAKFAESDFFFRNWTQAEPKSGRERGKKRVEKYSGVPFRLNPVR